MEFRIKLSPELIARIQKIKVGIRPSILSIVLTLMIGVSVLVIGINYLAVNSILIASSKNSLLYASGKIAEQVGGYLQPLNSNILTAYRMLDSEIIDPKRERFTEFLYSLIADNENLVAAYWGDVQGNVYWLNRNQNQSGFSEESVLRSDDKITRVIGRKLDALGKVLAEEQPLNPNLDPRLRPWYQQAKNKKSLTWIIYHFLEVGNQQPQLGVTSAFPVYNSHGNLQGVFGVDMLLGAISSYVENIKLTHNSFVFVVNLQGDLISVHTDRDYLPTLDATSGIDDISAPWLIESFKLYKQGQSSPFVYRVKGKNYVAAYEKIPGVKSDDPWLVAIVTPVSDIISPLLRNILISIIFTGLALLLGIVMASMFSASISRPIKKLAGDANLICQLRLQNVKHLFSRIKEVADMADSFIRMKNALYSFQRYMPITLVRKLMSSNRIAAVGGEAKELTLLFTDIKNFTQLSENFAPERLMQYLSEYFQNITKVIIEMSGTVDKYVGDGVMAFWGAPLHDNEHALHACQAVLQTQKVLQQLNAKWRLENQPEVVTRFGISSGEVIVGNVGSDDRLSYTSLGDAVNLASRLEGLNKIYGTTILVSEFTYKKVIDRFKFRLLDRVAVRGKTQGVYIYELLGELNAADNNHDAGKVNIDKYNQEFFEAFSNYEKGAWQSALELFRSLSKSYPDDRVAKIFVDRCLGLITNSPASWDGVWILDRE